MPPVLKRPALWIALLGSLLTLIGSWGLYRAELAQARRDFLQNVQLLATDLEIELKLGFEALHGLYSLFADSETVTREEFEHIAAYTLERHPEILALEWISRVSAIDRSHFEQKMRALYGRYRLWQRDQLRQAEAVADRPVYYPIQYLYPLSQGRRLLGMDVNFDPLRQHMLQRASAANSLYVTDPIDLLRYSPPRKGFFALIPLFPEGARDEIISNEEPFGFVRGVFRIDRLMEQLPYRPHTGKMRLVLTDVATTEGFETLYDSHPEQPFDPEDAYKVIINPSEGRAWALLATPLEPNSLHHAALWTPLQTGAVGLLLSGLVAALVHLLQRRSEQIERIVDRRTQELNQANERLKALSFTDELTGIANRRAFDTEFRREWRRAARHRSSLGIAMVDIDFFKRYNDHFGHPAGDRCLQQVTQRLQDEVKRPGDLLARYGGEEFVILLPHTDEQSALFGEQCRNAVESLQIPNPGSYYGVVTVSLGLAIAWPQPGDDSQVLLQAADDALYQAKETGRNRVQVKVLPAREQTTA